MPVSHLIGQFLGDIQDPCGSGSTSGGITSSSDLPNIAYILQRTAEEAREIRDLMVRGNIDKLTVMSHSYNQPTNRANVTISLLYKQGQCGGVFAVI